MILAPSVIPRLIATGPLAGGLSAVHTHEGESMTESLSGSADQSGCCRYARNQSAKRSTSEKA